jgi:chromate transporter
MVLPAASLVYAVTLFWQRAQRSRLRTAVEKGFPPLTVGLILATAVVMTRAADHDWRGYLLTAACTAVFLRTKINPLVVVAGAGVIGALGLV